LVTIKGAVDTISQRKSPEDSLPLDLIFHWFTDIALHKAHLRRKHS